jgi:hypothetical protein
MAMKLVRDIVIEALAEYADTMLTEGAGYNPDPKDMAEAAYGVVADAVANADRETYQRLTDILLRQVEVEDEDEPVAAGVNDAVADALRALVRALGVTL